VGVRFLLGDVWVGLRRNLSMAVSVVLVTMVSLYLLGLGLLAQRQADAMKGYWYDRVQVSIFLCSNGTRQANCGGMPVTEDQKATIKAQLDEMKPLVKQVFFESEQEAFDRFSEQFKNTPLVGNIKPGVIPSSYRVQLSDPTRYEVVASAFQNAPGVASVQDQEKVLKKFFQIINGVTVFALGLASLMAVCAALLMATTIRQAAFVRRREISIMRLVGASSWTIRMPFIIEMLIVATIGVALAVGMLWGAIQVIFNLGVNQVALSQAWIGTSDVLVVAPWLFGGVAVVALLTSLLTLRRYLRV
jgi:cell division transport system permease protein